MLPQMQNHVDSLSLRSICLPSSLACSWWETDEMAAWLDQNQMPVDA